MSINASLVKGAVGLISLSALSGGAGALYASAVTNESRDSKLTIEEAIMNNRNKSKEIFDALEKELGDRFKWNEDHWDALVEIMKEVVPEELHLQVVDYLWLGFPQIFFHDHNFNYYGFFSLMEGKWKVGDSNFRQLVEEIRSELSRGSEFWRIQKEEFKDSVKKAFDSYKNEFFNGRQIVALVNEKYLKVKKLFNLSRKQYSILYGINFPEWSDRIWGVVVFMLFFPDLRSSPWDYMYSMKKILYKDLFCPGGIFNGSCIQKLRELFGSTSEVDVKSDSSVPVWDSTRTYLTLEQAISKNREKLEKIFNALGQKLGERFKWEKNKGYWDILVTKMKEIVPEGLRLHLVDHLWSLLPGIESLKNLFWFFMNEEWKIDDSNFQQFVEKVKKDEEKNRSIRDREAFFDKYLKDWSSRLPEAAFSNLSGSQVIALVNDKYLRVKKVFEIYKKELWGEDLLSWSDDVWNSIVLRLFFDSRLSIKGEIFNEYMGTLLSFQSDEINKRLEEIINFK